MLLVALNFDALSLEQLGDFFEVRSGSDRNSGINGRCECPRVHGKISPQPTCSALKGHLNHGKATHLHRGGGHADIVRLVIVCEPEAIDELNRYYQNLIPYPTAAGCNITINFKQEPLEAVIESLELICDVQF